MSDRLHEHVTQIECDAYDLRGAALLARLAVDDVLRQGRPNEGGMGYKNIHLIEEQVQALTFGVHDLVNRAEKLVSRIEAYQEALL